MGAEWEVREIHEGVLVYITYTKFRPKIENMSFTLSVDQSYLMQSHLQVGFAPSSLDAPSDFIQVTCFPEWYDNITLQWNIPDTWGNCKFNVYFTPGGTDTYVKLNTLLLNNPFFKDSSSLEYSKFGNGNYVVEVIQVSTNRSIKSKPTFVEYKRREKIDKIAFEIQRREYLLLSKFAGVKSFFFKKRTYGVRCPRCWNERLEKVMDDHCEVCFGTSWEGGYFDPIPVFVQYESTPSSRLKGYHGELEPNSISGWTIALPEMHPDDVLVRTGDFSLYRVITVTPTELQTRPVKQTMNLTQLPKTDVENKLTNRTQLIESTSYLDNAGGVFRASRFPTNLIDKNKDNDPKWAQDQNLINLPKYTV